MKRSSGIQKTVAGTLVFTFTLMAAIVAPLQAAMVGTSDILQQQDREAAREKVMRFMERQDVVDYLSALGVGADEARERVAAMTDAEIAMLSQKIDQMPAGGDALGFLVGLAIVVFVVLVITDIIGVTDVFTFIKKQ